MPYLISLVRSMNLSGRVFAILLILLTYQMAVAGPLNEAISDGNLQLVKKLLKKDVDVNAKKNGYTPLMSTMLSSGLARPVRHVIMELLLQHGADPNAANKGGFTSLYYAAVQGDLTAARILIEGGANIDPRTWAGVTPLWMIAVNGDKRMAEYLIEKGADVNAKNNDGNTPLHAAAFSKFSRSDKLAAVSELLIERGTVINVLNNNGLTPLHMAATNNNQDVAEVLMKKGADVNNFGQVNATPLFLAAHGGHESMVRTIITHGGDVNAKEKQLEMSLLHIAVFHGKYSMAKILIANGAEVNAKDNRGQTPLDVAVSRGHTKVAELLRQHVAKELQSFEEEE